MNVCKSSRLTLLLCAGLFAGSQIVAGAQSLYAVGSTELYQIANYTSSPTAIPIGNTGQALTDIAVTPNGIGYGIDFGALYRVNLATGATTLISSENFTFNALAAASNTTLYAQGLGDTRLYSLNTTTGAATALFDTGFFSNGDLAVAPNGTDLYLAASNGHLVRLNLANSTATDIGDFGVSAVFGLAFINGTLYAGNNTPNLYTVNTSTGSATLIGPISGAGNFGLNGLAVSPAAVPEPGSVALLVGLGVTGTVFLRRRKQAQKSA